jgi:hypothetical protein
MEALAKAKGRDFRDMDLSEQDGLWEEVKQAEGQGSKGAGGQGGGSAHANEE